MATESSRINSSVVKRVLTSLDATIILPAIVLAILAVSVIGFAINPMTGVAQEKSSNQTEIVVAQTAEEEANLDRFDQLDFEAWNNRNWTLFEEIHSPDVLVVDFSGNTTRGIEQHLQWAIPFTSAAPESKVLAHPIKIATGDWTAVTGTLPGNGTMVTIAHWDNGRIVEEYLFSQGQ